MVWGKVVVQPSFWRGLSRLAAAVSTVAVGYVLGEFLAAGAAGLVARRLERRAADASSSEKEKGRATA